MAITVENKTNGQKYRVKCEYCMCEFTYQNEDLGYRPWYPHGFVYCPQCGKPLRHHKEYLVTDEQ